MMQRESKHREREGEGRRGEERLRGGEGRRGEVKGRRGEAPAALLGLETQFHYYLLFFLGPRRDDMEKRGDGGTRRHSVGRTVCRGLGTRERMSQKCTVALQASVWDVGPGDLIS